jgi:hypothetical protein
VYNLVCVLSAVQAESGARQNAGLGYWLGLGLLRVETLTSPRSLAILMVSCLRTHGERSNWKIHVGEEEGSKVKANSTFPPSSMLDAPVYHTKQR